MIVHFALRASKQPMSEFMCTDDDMEKLLPRACRGCFSAVLQYRRDVSRSMDQGRRNKQHAAHVSNKIQIRFRFFFAYQFSIETGLTCQGLGGALFSPQDGVELVQLLTWQMRNHDQNW